MKKIRISLGPASSGYLYSNIDANKTGEFSLLVPSPMAGELANAISTFFSFLMRLRELFHLHIIIAFIFLSFGALVL